MHDYFFTIYIQILGGANLSIKHSNIKKRQLNIGIVSLYGWLKLWDNYGTLLQNFALQKYLQQKGHNTFWIRTRPTLSYRSRSEKLYLASLSRFRSLIRLLLVPILGMPNPKRIADFNKRNPRYFSEFMTRHVPTSPSEFTIEELIDNPLNVDALIVGSDQIWRDATKLNFLGFGPQQIRRVAYAVSAPWPALNQSWYQSAIQFSPRLDAVSVREVEGLEVCKNLQISNPVHVIDPVLLLTEQHYLNIVQESGEDKIHSSPFLLGYFVNIHFINQIPWDSTVDFANNCGYDFRAVPMQGAELVIPEKYSFTPSPSAWLNAFHKADCVVTNSYHGALFAIIMRKPFLVFLQGGVKSHENCRFTSALNPLGLSERILANDSWKNITSSELYEQMFRPIDWEGVNIALNDWREVSMGFLDKALEA